MRTESFVLSVLPLTVRANARFHVSLHIAPRLTPNGVQELLGVFERFSEWGSAARAATFQLLSNAGAITATPLLDRIDPALWNRVFPPDTVVKAPRFDSFPNRTWRSFPVKSVHDIAASMPVLGAMFFPLDPPDLKSWMAPRRGEDGSPVGRLIGELGHGDGRDDAALTAGLDGAPGGVPLGNDSAWKPVLEALHAARRYYERPEAQRPYHERPTDGLVPKPAPRPHPDFHERVAHLADQPELLRRLGLVIDVDVTDLVALKAATELHAGTSIGPPVAVIAARTPVTRLGSTLLTVPRSDDWSGGRLKLGDTNRYSVLAMDSDGAALKAERYIRSLPRMQAMAINGDPGDAAPPALRSEGFTLVQQGRLSSVQSQLTAAGTMVANATPASPPSIFTEDVTRGYRIQIWDDHVKAWFSPHRRLATATASGTVVYTDWREHGYVQTAAVNETPGVPNGPIYLHEAMFGWSGWSLSAPRPGPRAEPSIQDGKQIETAKEVSPPTEPISPVQVTTRVEPGTLPRLRYGRSYMFRAWSVDLAGNSPGDPVPFALPGGQGATAATAPPDAATAPALTAAALRPVLDRIAVNRPARLVSAALPGVHALALSAARLPASLTQALVTLPFGSPSQFAQTGIPAAPALTGVSSIDALAVARLQSRSVAPPSALFAGPVRIDEALATLTLEPVAASRADSLARITTADLDLVDGIEPAQFVTLADQTVTPLKAFLRWDPVPPPAVVARHRFSMAESIHHMVIRSGVETAPDGMGGDITTVTPPDEFIAATPPPLGADFRATSERHLAAPKGSQVLNELHGRFDPAIGGATDAERRAMLCAALRDDGTLFSTAIVSLADPDQTVPQPGISLQAGPEVATPVTDLGALNGGNRGNAPPPGHYVVHDIDALALPWLPDPLAAGVALGMNTANRGSPLVGAFRVESTAARYEGDWPAPEPFRLVLETAPASAATVDGKVITVGLPPGSRLNLRLSSSLRREELSLLAIWSLLPASLTDLDLYSRPAADGQFWTLSAFEPISLVHAVPRPVLPPVNTAIVAGRIPGETGATLAAVINVHASSTDRLDAEASWSEWTDELTAPGPVRESKRAIPFHAQLATNEDMVLFGANDDAIDVPGIGPVRVHRARHEFSDTRHRVVDYAFRASTRFREYFPLEMMATKEQRSVLGAPSRISLPSTAPPPAPVIDSVVPLFRWDEVGDPGQPFGIRRRRRSGLRVYIERPWYRTGDDEQLAVILGSTAEAAGVHGSVWGSDSVWFNAGPASPVVGFSVEDLYGAGGLDDVRGPDPRLSPLAMLPGPHGSTVGVIGYRPDYSVDRKLWFVDVAIEPAAAVWPFVRLAVARYQPNALPDLELSPIVLCDFTQLPPERTMTVSRPDATTVRVTVSGPAGLREAAPTPPPQRFPTSNPSFGTLPGAPAGPPPIEPGRLGAAGPYPLGAADPTLAMAKDRRVYAVLEHRDPDFVSDLDWSAVHRQELSLGGLSPTGEFAWTGVIDTGTPLPLVGPGASRQWRITVEEHEGIEGDPAVADSEAPLVKQWRLIYADRTLL